MGREKERGKKILNSFKNNNKRNNNNKTNLPSAMKKKKRKYHWLFTADVFNIWKKYGNESFFMTYNFCPARFCFPLIKPHLHFSIVFFTYVKKKKEKS